MRELEPTGGGPQPRLTPAAVIGMWLGVRWRFSFEFDVQISPHVTISCHGSVSGNFPDGFAFIPHPMNFHREKVSLTQSNRGYR